MKLDLYVQIKNHYETLIKTGVYKPGEMLPSLRTVASELGVNPNTVEKAYQQLSNDGYIEIIPKKGAFVKTFMDNFDATLKVQLKTIILELKKQKSKEDVIKIVQKLLEDTND